MCFQYDNGFVYEYSQVAPSLPVLQFYSHPEGYVKVGPTTTNSRGDQVYTDFTYVYQYKDHLGNVRLSYQGTDDITDNATGTAPTGFVSTSNGGTISTVTYNNIPQVRVGVQAAWSGGGKKLDNAATVAGTAYKLTLTLDKGTVAGNLRLRIAEQGGSGGGSTLLYEGTATQSGTYVMEFTTTGAQPDLYVRIDKGDGALSLVRYFYVSRVKVERKGVSVVEEDNYYAFGMKHKGYNTNVQPNANTAAQRYKYNGKELQDELGLNWYDYGARNYDPALGRWFNIDLLAESSKRFSPYTYALNNPVYFIDPDGMEASAAMDEMDLGGKIDLGTENGGSGNGSSGIDPPKPDKGTIDPPKPGEGTSTGNKQIKNPDGSPSGVDAPPTELPEVAINVDKSADRLVPIVLSEKIEKDFKTGVESLALIGVVVVVSQSDGPAPGPGDILAAMIIAKYVSEKMLDGEMATTIGHYDAMSRKNSKSSESDYGSEAEHTKGKRKSTKTKHEKGQTRKGKDKGGEKGDKRRTRYK